MMKNFFIIMDIIKAIENNDERYIFDNFRSINFDKIDINDLNFDNKLCYYFKIYFNLRQYYFLYNENQLYNIFKRLFEWQIQREHLINLLFDFLQYNKKFQIKKYFKLFDISDDYFHYKLIYYYTVKKNKYYTKWLFFQKCMCNDKDTIIPYFLKCYITDKKLYKRKYYFKKYFEVYEKNFFLFKNRDLIYRSRLQKYYIIYAFKAIKIDNDKYKYYSIFIKSHLNIFNILYFIFAV